MLTWADFDMLSLLTDWILPIIARGGLTGALFVIVMYAGAFPARSLGAKTFMPVRGQLSIIASILGIFHGIAYSRTYIKMSANGLGELKATTIIFIIDSIIMSVIMLPLFITSFISVRKKMSAIAWKRLQRLAYAFYLLLFIHVMLLMVPRALNSEPGYDLTVFVYGFIFISYFACRIIKAANKGNIELIPRKQIVAMASSLFVSTLFVAVIINSNTVNAKSNDETQTDSIAEDASARQKTDALQDGTFYGEDMGNNGNIGVEVTIEDGMITNIVFTKFVDDEEFFDTETDGEVMIEKVIDAQSTDVDGISGATYSSEGFLGAVENALSQARNN